MTSIKELRRRAAMTQKEFSNYLKIPFRTIQNWELETRKPPEYVVDLIEYKLVKEGLQERWVDYGPNEILIDGKGKVVRCVKTLQGNRTTAYPYVSVKDGWQNATGCDIDDLLKGLEDGSYIIK